MVNLNRQIGVSQARQGGFSAHVLPEPIGYQSVSDVAIVYTDGASIISTNPRATLTIGDASAIPLAADGGRFGDPYITGSNTSFGNAKYQLELGDLAPGTDPFTLEAWYRTRASVTEDFPTICEIVSGFADGSPFSSSYFDTTRDTCNHFYGISSGDDIEKRESSTPAQWRHFAMSRVGTSIRGYDQGSYIGTVWYGTEPGLITFSDSAKVRGGMRLDLGQLRYTKGQALYTGSIISVPTEPFISV